jgi:RNA polymerase sigma-70 factor, ECF subfamily
MANDDTPVNSEQLITACQAGDEKALQQLVKEHQDYAFRLARRLLGDEAEAADVVQESFIRVWRHIQRFDPDKKFTTWLYQIVTHLAWDRLRSKRRRRAIFALWPQDDLEATTAKAFTAEVEGDEFLRLVEGLARRLPAKQQLVFMLRDLENQSMMEIVELTGLSLASVKSNLYYARRSLRKQLMKREPYVSI